MFQEPVAMQCNDFEVFAKFWCGTNNLGGGGGGGKEWAIYWGHDFDFWAG